LAVENGLLKIYKYGEEVLKQKAAPIARVDDRIQQLVKRMIETMHKTPGIGLAATQIGEPLQLATVDVSIGEDPKELLVLVNPIILSAEGTEINDEGCLSFPHCYLPIKRHCRLLLQAYTLDGKEIRQEFEGFKSRVIQHEIDHLDGILIIDRVSHLKRTLIRQEIKKLKQSGQW